MSKWGKLERPLARRLPFIRLFLVGFVVLLYLRETQMEESYAQSIGDGFTLKIEMRTAH